MGTAEKKLFWMSPFSLADGYGVAATAFLEMLTKRGYTVNLHETWFCVRSELAKWAVEMLERCAKEPATERIGVCMSTPGAFARLPTPIKIGYTMYESTQPERRFPDWYKSMDAADALLVPAPFSQGVFSAHYHKPIFVVPLPLLTRYMDAEVTPRFKNETVIFGIHGTLTERKAPLETIKAFRDAFPPDIKDVRLEVKTRVVLDQSRVMPDIDDPRIHIINETWPPATLLRWLRHIDCHLFISRGEGFGLPPRESMVTGCPVIASETSSMVDLKGHAYTVPIKNKVQTHIGGIWEEPDFNDLVDKFRFVYQNREKASQRGVEAANWYRTAYSHDNIERIFAAVLGGVSGLSVRPGRNYGDKPGDFQALADLLRARIPPRSRILLSRFPPELGNWFAARAFSIVDIIAGNEELPAGTENIQRLYGDPYSMRTVFSENSFDVACIRLSREELTKSNLNVLLDELLALSPVVFLVIESQFFRQKEGMLLEQLHWERWPVGNYAAVYVDREIPERGKPAIRRKHGQVELVAARDGITIAR